MEIICSVCSHIITKAEILGHLTDEAFDFCKNYLFPFLLAQQQILLQQQLSNKNPLAQNVAATRGIVSDIQESLINWLMGIINHKKIECTKCHKYTKWTTAKIAMQDDPVIVFALEKETFL